MGQIHNIEKLTDCKFLNLYHLNATSVHNTPVSYFVASRAKSINELKIKTGKNTPDGVIIYSLYGEKRDRVVLVRQYRYAIGGYIYEFPAGLVEPNEEFHEGAVREMYEETGLKFTPLKVDPSFEKPYFTTVGMTDESCATVYGYAEGEISKDAQGIELAVTIDVTEGEKLPDTAQVAGNAGRVKSITYYSDGNEIADATSDGYEYGVKMIIEPAEGTEFSALTTAKINGMDAQVVINLEDGTPRHGRFSPLGQ